MEKIIKTITVDRMNSIGTLPVYADIATAINQAEQNKLTAQYNKQDDYIENYGGIN